MTAGCRRRVSRAGFRLFPRLLVWVLYWVDCWVLVNEFTGLEVYRTYEEGVSVSVRDASSDDKLECRWVERVPQHGLPRRQRLEETVGLALGAQFVGEHRKSRPSLSPPPHPTLHAGIRSSESVDCKPSDNTRCVRFCTCKLARLGMCLRMRWSACERDLLVAFPSPPPLAFLLALCFGY